MTHDPMCSFQVPTSYCKECELIARVREDEQTHIYSSEAMEEVIRLAASKAYDAALRDAVEAVKALDTWSDGSSVFAWQNEAVAAIEALGGER